MNKIIKVLNNNTLLIQQDQDEIIVMYKGIGFGKKANEPIEIPLQAKKFMMLKDYQGKEQAEKVTNYIDPIYLEIAAEIIKEATLKFDKVNHDILIDRLCKKNRR